MRHKPDNVKLIPVYPLAAAAKLVGSTRSTLRAWFRGRQVTLSGEKKSYAAKLPTASQAGEPISFIDLVEAHVFLLIRKRYRIPKRHMRAASEYLSEIKGDLTILAHKDFYVDSNHLLLRVEDKMISLSERGQLVDEEILESGLRQLIYGSDGYASEFFPSSAGGDQRDLVVSPTRNFGRLCIHRSGVGANIIAARFKRGEKITDIAADYAATVDEIGGAIRWHECLAA